MHRQQTLGASHATCMFKFGCGWFRGPIHFMSVLDRDQLNILIRGSTCKARTKAVVIASEDKHFITVVFSARALKRARSGLRHPDNFVV